MMLRTTITTTSVMEKSIGTKMYLHLMLVLIMCCVLRASAGSASNTDINNSLNPYSQPSTSGSIVASPSSSSTAQSLPDTNSQTLPINEQQPNVLTTVYQSRHQHLSTVDAFAVEKERMTTTLGEGAFSSSTTHSGGSVASTESSFSSQINNNNQNTQETPAVVISTGTSSPSTILPSQTSRPDDNIEQQPPAIPSVEHVLLGCGPNNREGIGIQKALDWLKEKRVPDFGWENDTHMVILAKEVSTYMFIIY